MGDGWAYSGGNSQADCREATAAQGQRLPLCLLVMILGQTPITVAEGDTELTLHVF